MLSIAPVFFHPQQSAASGTAPESTVVADMNGDGKPDIVVANYGSGTVSVMLGHGDGTFGSPRTFACGPTGNQAVVADVNHDGIPDVIVANATDNTVSVLLGNGDGSLLARKIFPAGSDPRSVAVGDFNKDGKLDLAVNNTDSTVSILLGNGDGTFLTATTTQPGADDSLTIAVGDLNGDGNPDIVTAGDNLVIDFGDGHGDISSDKIIPLAADSFSVAVADINGDGKPDVVLAYPSSKSVGVLLGTGQTNLNPVQTYSTGNGSDPRAVAIADVNGDGKPDAIVINSTARNTEVLLGKGDGSFGAPTTFGSSAYGYSFTVADVNGDGRPDLIAPDLYGSDTKVLLNDPPPAVVSIDRAMPATASTQAASVTFAVTFSEPVSGVSGADFSAVLDPGMSSAAPTISPSTGLFAIYQVTVSGITGTGDVGLEMVGIGGGATVVNDVGESLTPPVGFGTKIQFTPQAYATVIADMDGDGKPDVVIADSTQDDVSIDLGNGDGITQPPQSFSTDISLSESSSVSAVAVADLNGDGKLDVVAAESDDNQVGVFLGNGNGTLQPQVTYDLGSGADPISIEVGDVNRDGKPDLIVANYSSASVGVLIGNGNGTFNAVQTLSVGSFPVETALADLNGDGIPDLIVASQNALSIGVLMGFAPPHGVVLSTPPFRPEQTFAVGGSISDFQVGDVNRDGKPDLIVDSFDSNSPGTAVSDVAFLAGNGQGAFAAPVESPASTGLTDATLIDMNGDGKADMIGVDQSNKVGMMLGNGDGTFNDEDEFNIAVNKISIADMNRDGKPDAIVSGLASTAGILLSAGSNEFAGQAYTILPRDVALTITGAKVTFDGNPHPAIFSATGANGEDLGSLVSLSYTDTSNNTSSSDPPTQLGTYEVFASFAGNASYYAINSFDTGKTVVISPHALLDATLSVTGASVTFDGDSHAATLTAVGANGEDLSSLASLDYLNTANNTSSATPPTQIGTYEVFAGFAGNESYNRIDSFDTGKSIVISAKALLNVSLTITGANAVFDDNPHPATFTAIGANGEDLGSLVSLSYTDTSNNTASTSPPTQIGTYDVFASFAGNDSYNAIDSFDTGKTIFISSHSLLNATLTVTGADVIYDGDPHAGAVAALGANGEDLSSLATLIYTDTANNTSSSSPPTQVGTYDIFASFAGNDTYYPIDAFDTGKMIAIASPALGDATLTVTGADALFDGNPHPAAVTAIGVSGEDLSSLAYLSYINTADNTSSATPPTQVGTYEVFASFAGNDSYNAIASFDTGKSVVISPLSSLQSIPFGKLPTTPLIAGQTIKPIHLNVKVTNDGASAVTELVTVNVTLASSADGTPQDPVVGTISKTVKLKSHQTAAFGSVVINSLPAGLNGIEHLIFKLTDPSGATNLASAGTISVGPASNDLAAISIAAPTKASVGKKLLTTVGVRQIGNIPFIGSLPIEIFLSTDGMLDSGAVDLGSSSGHFSIQPGKRGIEHLSFTLPSNVATGSYFLIAELNPADTLGDSNALNNFITSSQLTSLS